MFGLCLVFLEALGLEVTKPLCPLLSTHLAFAARKLPRTSETFL